MGKTSFHGVRALDQNLGIANLDPNRKPSISRSQLKIANRHKAYDLKDGRRNRR